jgi:hypothetical protein
MIDLLLIYQLQHQDSGHTNLGSDKTGTFQFVFWNSSLWKLFPYEDDKCFLLR